MCNCPPAPGSKRKQKQNLAGGWGHASDAGWIDPSGKEILLGTESHEAAARKLVKKDVSWEAVRTSTYVEGKYTAELLRQGWIRRRGCDFAAWLRPVGHRVVSRDVVWRIHDNAGGCSKLFAEVCNENGCRAIGPYAPEEMATELGGLRWRRGGSPGHRRLAVPRFRGVRRRSTH